MEVNPPLNAFPKVHPRDPPRAAIRTMGYCFQPMQWIEGLVVRAVR